MSRITPRTSSLKSWLEHGLTCQALFFRLTINNQEIIVVLQNSSYLEQVVSEGMRLGMDAFGQSHWSMNASPPHTLLHILEILFYHPSLLGPIFTPGNTQQTLTFPMDLVMSPPSPPSTLLYPPSPIIPPQPLSTELDIAAI